MIKPIVWIPFDAAQLPVRLAPVQFKRGAPDSVYSTKGLRLLVLQKQRYKSQYFEFVTEFADELLRDGAAYPLPALNGVPSLENAPVVSTLCQDSAACGNRAS